MGQPSPHSPAPAYTGFRSSSAPTQPQKQISRAMVISLCIVRRLNRGRPGAQSCAPGRLVH